ncbi:Sphingolipid C4-hydroxylase sur2 [Ciborinia camelliae]|nr:Sphingolipid C4-hydroxylase sur2 [Ciborinia camelliae]
MSNLMNTSSFPPAPSCTLHPRSSILPGIPDHTLGVVLPTLVYIAGSVVFYIFNELELFSNYRIHPFKDDLHRNRVSRLGCLLNVIRYHVMQIGIGLLLTYNNKPELVEMGGCEMYQWARRVRKCFMVVPWTLTLLGLDTQGLMSTFRKTPLLSHILANSQDMLSSPNFTAIEWNLARIVHAQHHQLYVPYAYGAVYTHWLETIFLDVLSFILASTIAGISVRQGMIFSSLATLKTITDHCGYVFPQDPFGWINDNNAKFHDLHHQSWGLKYNFSTYTVFWDKLLGTQWTDVQGADMRYSRTHELVKARMEVDEVTVAHRKVE